MNWWGRRVKGKEMRVCERICLPPRWFHLLPSDCMIRQLLCAGAGFSQQGVQQEIRGREETEVALFGCSIQGPCSAQFSLFLCCSHSPLGPGMDGNIWPKFLNQHVIPWLPLCATHTLWNEFLVSSTLQVIPLSPELSNKEGLCHFRRSSSHDKGLRSIVRGSEWNPVPGFAPGVRDLG
jgi:hypothetical protein